MIAYMLKCANEHEFEVWFGRGSDFDEQAKKRQIECPQCGNTQVEKAPMAPNVHGVKKHNIDAQADSVRQHLADNCDNVGEGFAEEARAIHYGEKPKRGIYGRASLQDVMALSEEGVQAVSLPDTLVPKPKKKLN